MKILFVNERYGYLGGVEQNVVDTSEGLRARGHACTLAYGTVTDRGDVDRYETFFDGCFRCAEIGSDPAAYSFETILDRVAPDGVYLHKFAELRPLERHLSNVRAVRVVHDHDLCCPSGLKYYRFNGRICRHRADWRCWADGGFLARSSGSRIGFALSSIGRKLKEMRRNRLLDALIVDSHFMREELLQSGFPPEKVHILPHIVRLPDPTPSDVPDEPKILYVGQLIRGKGVDLLLHALQQVSCDFTATIVGTGNAQESLEALCHKLGLADRVRFQGWMDREKLDTFYSSAKVVVVPSRWAEPFGMVGLEAMNFGRATVAFDVGGIPDWLDDGVTGLLAPEQNTTAFARALERVLTDTGFAATLGRNARERVRKHYSFERYLDQVEAHLCGEMQKSTVEM